MRPVLLTIGDLHIPSHSAFAALGAVIALWSGWHIARRQRRINHEFLLIVAGGTLGAAIMARYGLSIRYVLEPGEATLAGLLAYGGQTVLGGLAGAYFGVILVKRLLGYRQPTGDILVPGAALAIAVGRIGCFLAERPGTPTTLPWGVRIPPEYANTLRDCEGCLTGAAMHPSFLYESAFLFVIAWWLFRVSRRGSLPATWMVEGDLWKLFLLTYAPFRFLVEFVRGNPEMALGLSGSQLMVLPAFIALGLHFLRRWRSPGRVAVSPAT